MASGLTLLENNGAEVTTTDAEIEEVALLIADSKQTGYTEADLKHWLESICSWP